MPLNTSKLDLQRNNLKRMYLLLEDLQEGLPFNGPRKPDESSMHYFQMATHICTQAQESIDNYADFVEDHFVKKMNRIWNQVVEWDLADEGISIGDLAQERSKVRCQQKFVKKVCGNNGKFSTVSRST